LTHRQKKCLQFLIAGLLGGRLLAVIT
jgi:hypothetical protein